VALLVVLLTGLAPAASAVSSGSVIRLTTDPTPKSAPFFSPDGTRIAFTSLRDGGLGELYAMDSDGQSQLRLTDTGIQKAGDAVWSPDGKHVAFTQLEPYMRPGESESCCEAEIHVVKAKGGKAENISNATFTLPGVEPLNPSDDGQPTWSPDSKQVAFFSGRTGDLNIWVRKLNGNQPTNLTATPEFDVDGGPAWSPTGDQIAFHSSRHDPPFGPPSLYVMNSDGSGVTRLTEGFDLGAKWSPDGTKIAFVRISQGDLEIYTMNADGSNEVNVSNLPGSQEANPSWSGDSQHVSFDSTADNLSHDLYIVRSDGSSLTNLTETPGVDEVVPSWSPTADEIAFLGNADDQFNYEIYKILVSPPVAEAP
jgi:TolB protein